MPLSAALRITRLSSSRYHSWCRAEVGCELDDQSSCSRVVPTRLTPKEVDTVQEMVESDDHRHMSLRGLALHAQRIGKIFASPSTWYRLVRVAGWRRPRNRVYPARPKIGIRAAAPGELLHSPDEMYFGTGSAVPADLASARKAAREERIKANRAAACNVCLAETDSRALLVQRPRCRML